MTARHISLDPLGGIAGDMFVAAMLHALPEMEDPVMGAMAAVLPPGVETRLVSCHKNGLAACRFEVTRGDTATPTLYPDLSARIADAPLAPDAITHAQALLHVLAVAEAEVHGCRLDHVHFHEIADWDTLADLTAAAVILTELGDATWAVGSLPLGGGRVETAHGTLAVPAPATARLMQGLTVHDDGIGGERVTPTGAAIARYLSKMAGDPVSAKIIATGYGAGTRDIDGMPNVLVARVLDLSMGGADSVTVIGFDVDDMTGEEVGAAAERLRAVTGVIDLIVSSAQGKKGRPVTTFRLLVVPASAHEVAEACFAQTTTIGLRYRRESRLLLDRATDRKGQVRLKRIARPGGQATAKAEADDLADGATLADRRRAAREAET